MRSKFNVNYLLTTSQYLLLSLTASEAPDVTDREIEDRGVTV